MSRDSPIAEVIRTRRTIHDFKPQPPPRELVEQALDVARWAPNHGLTQPWRFYWLGRETVEAIARLNAELVSRVQGRKAGDAKLARWLNVPGWMLVTCVQDGDPIRAREDYAACCCAAHNFALFLWDAGVGVKWVTGKVIREPRFYRLMGIDALAESVVALLWYGYPAKVPSIKRKPVADFLFEKP